MQSAKWIWPEGCGTHNVCVCFEDDFQLDDARGALVHVSVSGDYVLYINGEMAGFGQYNDWPERKSFDTCDVSAYCRVGQNRFELSVWHQDLDTQTDVAGPARAWFEIVQNGEALLVSGTHTRGGADGRYACDVPLITGQLGYSFAFDANVPPSPLGACVETASSAALRPRPVAALRLEQACAGELCAQGVLIDVQPNARPAVRMRRAALSMRFVEEMDGGDGWLQADGGDGLYLVYDLGGERAGLFSLDADFDAPTDVLIGFGEHLSDLRVRTDIDGRSFCAVYRAKPGRNRFTHWFRRLGCRYLQLHVCAPRVRVRFAGLLPVNYPVDESPLFSCGDHLHNRIYEVARDTLRLCMHTHYEDCPWREQALYAMDSRLQMLCGYYAFGETAMPRASIALLAEGLREDGLLEICAPAKAPITIPAFSLNYIIELWEYVLYTGDTAFAREQIDTAERILTAFAARTDERDRALRFTEKQYWNFYEWQPGLDGGRIGRDGDLTVRAEGPLTAYLALALDAMANLLRALGRDASDIEAWRSRTVAALQDFWDEKSGAYAAFIDADGERSVYSQLMQALALLCGGVPEARARSLRHRLAFETDLISATLNDAMLRYQALMQEETLYADFVFDEIARVWGEMLFSGATSFWETALGERDFHNAGSLCHGWSAIPAYFYFAHGLGVRPTAPGRFVRFSAAQTRLDPIEARLPGFMRLAEEA